MLDFLSVIFFSNIGWSCPQLADAMRMCCLYRRSLNVPSQIEVIPDPQHSQEAGICKPIRPQTQVTEKPQWRD